MNLTHLSSPPASVDDALTPDDDLGCTNCGDSQCSCDERCPGCMQRFQSKADADFGLCGPCAQDAAEAGYDDFGGEAA